MSTDFFEDVVEFEKAIRKAKGDDQEIQPSSLNVAYIERMMMDELSELHEADDEAEQVDAILDMVYYLLNSIARMGLDARPIWKLIHEANMSKFTLPGGYQREDGKWIKPPGFVPPDDKIREEVKRQRSNGRPEEASVQDLIAETCDEIKRLLIEKNRSYGNSFADPEGIFFKGDPIQAINVRIDDKLKRIKHGQEFRNEDTELDLIGYLILKRVLKKTLDKPTEK